MNAGQADATMTDREFRDAMGRFATGVTIITTPDEGRVHGMTANGFMSVSLEPRLVLVSLANRSRMREIVEATGVYGVSVLSAAQESLSDHFAGRVVPDLEPTFASAEGIPVVEGALAQIAASVVDLRPAGDHTLVIGEVRWLRVRDERPLIFHGGVYRGLADVYEWSETWRNPDEQWY
jgi:flavin reductase